MIDADELERQAAAAYLEGRDAESSDLWTRAFDDWLNQGDTRRALRCAFWQIFGLLQRGELARANGWLARAQRLLETLSDDCVERGYLLFPVAIKSIFAGDAETARRIFAEAGLLGEKFRDPDLITLARNGEGRATIRCGDVEGGVRLLDEAMAVIESGNVSPAVAGDAYCSLIEACYETFDLRRAFEWTNALSRWCETQPKLVAYRGQCLTRRAEMLQLRGDWDDAAHDALQACYRLSNPPPPQRALGAALYQRAELHRLRGEFEQADELYREASQWDSNPRPGLARLRLAQNQVGVAFNMIRVALDEVRSITRRTHILAAYVEIAIAAHDVSAARKAADELSAIAARINTPLMNAEAAYAEAAVRLAEEDAARALRAARRAVAAWQQLDGIYGAARARVLIAAAARKLGDEQTAQHELASARAAFEQLGAAPDLARSNAGHGDAQPEESGLTARELQVLRLIAQGCTNKAIAERLFISEKTVARHVANIFVKLNLTNRAGAAAYAFQHALI